MNKAQQITIITWLKRFFGFTAILLWLYILFSISQSPAPFREQAPYCMASTMIIFGFLSLVFKGLEYWGKRIDEGTSNNTKGQK